MLKKISYYDLLAQLTFCHIAMIMSYLYDQKIFKMLLSVCIFF